MVKYNVQSSRNQRKKSIWVIISIFLVLGLITIFVVNATRPKNEYLKNLAVTKANIIEKSIEDGKFYIRFNVLNTDNNIIVINSDNSWFEVKESYFNSRTVFDEAGVLVGNYDVFKKKLFGKGQKFQKSVWVIEDIYESYEAARSANPIKKYSESATIKKKKALSNGAKIFILEAQERKFNLEVQKETYDKYNENQKVECEFEAMGEFVKIIGVKE